MKFDIPRGSLAWLVAVGAIVCGAVVYGVFQRWRIDDVDARISIALVLALKLVTSRKPEAKLSWIRLTILELVMVPVWSGRERLVSLGTGLAILALTCVATLRVPESRLRLSAIYAMPLASLVLLKVLAR